MQPTGGKRPPSINTSVLSVHFYTNVVGTLEMASNRREDHEISMLSLHLIQNCMVYINTLMIQKVLARPRWQQAMTPRDYAALTPLIWSHVNPYGRFDLDMNARMALA